MKVIEINGSPRINGNTAAILDLCKLQEYEQINLSRYNLKPCKGCRICLDLSEDKCPNKDELLLIKDKLESADCIIAGSPVYVEDVSGTMKNFIDRMAFNCHRPFLNGKPVYLYTTSASIASKHAVKTLKNAFSSWGGSVIACDNFRMGKKMQLEAAEKKFGNIISKRLNSLEEFYAKEKVTFYGLLSFAIQKSYWGKFKETADYKYWFKKNWLKPECIYYKDVHLNIFKKFAAKLINSVVKISLK